MCLSFAITLQNELAHAPQYAPTAATLPTLYSPALPYLPQRPEAKAKVLTDKKCMPGAGKDFNNCDWQQGSLYTPPLGRGVGRDTLPSRSSGKVVGSSSKCEFKRNGIIADS